MKRVELPGGGVVGAQSMAADAALFGPEDLADAKPDELYRQFLANVVEGSGLDKEALGREGQIQFAESVRKARYICMGMVCAEFGLLLRLAKDYIKGDLELEKGQVDVLKFLMGKILPDGRREVGFVAGWMKEAQKLLGDGMGVEGLLGAYRKEDV